MSGGFFRGTSAEQDTRFSNKQAKLMKSQKFAPELDHLVDMTKVKADVIRPWIAKRVTELLGFEDEVLINFIYGLLDGKVVNGKEVQISLTGFMEKNTGKFMKELWSLLLTAQANATGVPQQFLDAKEEETRKRKEESDRIANEIQKKKEKELREFEEERSKRMAGGVDRSKKTNAMEPNSKQMRHRTSSASSEDEDKPVKRNGLRRKSGSRSPNSANRSSSPLRGTPQSISRSRSQSVEIRKSRTISGSPQLRHDSISSERGHYSRRRRSVTPRRRYSPRGSISPSRRRSSFFRKRSSSRSHRRSPSPIRRRQRSPHRRESLTPQRRSPSPIRRRPSPLRHRSPSPVRRRSPYMRRRFSPMHRRSRSPLRRRSPVAMRRRVPSPVWRRSPSPMRRRSPSPLRRRRRRSSSTPRQRSPSPVWHKSSIYGRKRSPSPSRATHRSASPNKRISASPGRDGSLSGRRKSPKYQKSSSLHSPRQRTRICEEPSPTAHASLRNKVDPVVIQRGLDSMTSRPLISLRSPQRDPNEHRDLNRKATSLSPLQDKSSSLVSSPQHARERSPSEDNWSSSPHESPVKQTRESTRLVSSQSRLHKPREHSCNKSPERSGEEDESTYSRKKYSNPKSLLNDSTDPSKSFKQKDSSTYVRYKEVHPTDRGNGRQATGTPDKSKLRKDDQETSEKSSVKVDHLVRPEKKMPESSHIGYSMADKQQLLDSVEGCVADVKTCSHSRNVKGRAWHVKPENVSKLKTTIEVGQISRSLDSGSEENERHRAEVKRRKKHKRSRRKELRSDDDYSTDSEIEERKEAKRRRKEEKRLRKEERRLRRKERHRIRDERRAEKLKGKSSDTVLPAAGSLKNQNDACGPDGEHGARHDSHSTDAEDSESEQIRLETELRNKALESLKAKKGLDH